MNKPRLEILIAAYGADGIRRVASGRHPRMAGVMYTVTWQNPDETIPDELSSRDDFRILKYHTKGSSTNHNHGLEAAIGDIILISDDDVSYTPEGLTNILNRFDENPDCDFLTFRFSSDSTPKNYPSESFSWNCPPKGAYVSNIEIALRRKVLTPAIRFNENFGVNCFFPCGEDQLFLHSLLKSGLRGKFIPLDICFHPGESTGTSLPEEKFAEAKGAMFLQLHPLTWPLRMLAHARRSNSPLTYCRHWLNGIRRYIEKGIRRQG